MTAPLRTFRGRVAAAVARRAAALAAVVIIGAAACPACADSVERRGRLGTLEGTVTRIGDDGVEITTRLDARHLVPWDRVRRVETTSHAARAAEMMPIADSLWRARSRVERGDLVLAEPLLERLFERYRGQSNETALVVAEGLLRCRLSRGDQAAAVIPYLETVRLRRLRIETDSYAALSPVIDDETSLCPLLPPLLPEGPSLSRLRSDFRPYGDPVVDALAAAYLAAAVVRRDGSLIPGRPMPLPDGEAEADAGVGILVATVNVMAARAAEGADARRLHLPAIRGEPESAAFVGAWATLADGVSLLDRDDPAQARRGVVRLLAVVAGHGRRLPWLAGATLLIAASAEAQIGDPTAAAVLQRELQVNHSHHPLVAPPARRAGLNEEPS